MAINRVIIEGNLTRDVEMRATASGLAVAGFTVAVNEKRHELSVIVDQLEFSGGKREQTGDAPAPELDLYDEDIPF